MNTSFKNIKMISLIIAICLSLLFVIPGYAESDQPPQPEVVPAEVHVYPSGQTVESSELYVAHWTATILGEGATYTLETWFGEGSYYRRENRLPDTDYPYVFDYSDEYPATYYQTWKASGLGGPAYAYTQVIRASY